MRERRLLERISSLEDSGGRTSEGDVEVLKDSIIGHLQRILNTRQGSVPIREDFGVPDFTNVAGSIATGSTREIEKSINEVIEKYEPRVKSPRISFKAQQDDVFSMRFELQGDIEVDDRRIPIQFMTAITPEGKVKIVT